jgi:hypothetical protein
VEYGHETVQPNLALVVADEVLQLILLHLLIIGTLELGVFSFLVFLIFVPFIQLVFFVHFDGW